MTDSFKLTEPFQIKILKANPSRMWYNHHINEVFDVVRVYYDDYTYLVQTKDAFNTTNIVHFEDCTQVD